MTISVHIKKYIAEKMRQEGLPQSTLRKQYKQKLTKRKFIDDALRCNLASDQRSKTVTRFISSTTTLRHGNL